MPDASGTVAFDFHRELVAALPGLRQQAMALTRRAADADDLVQAAVTNALAARSSFLPGTNFRAWLARILRNRFLSNIRARRESVAIEDAEPHYLAISGSQESSLAVSELRRHMARLSEDQRLALLMIAVQGASYEEAAEALAVPVGTVKARVSRARRQLQIWLLGEESEEQVRRPAPRPANSMSRRTRGHGNIHSAEAPAEAVQGYQ